MIKNIDKINKLKRSDILKSLRYIEKISINEKYFDKIIIFGSSINSDCSDDSDIDVCFFTEKNIKNPIMSSIFSNFETIANNPCDIFVYSLLKDKLKNEIQKKGIVVYEY